MKDYLSPKEKEKLSQTAQRVVKYLSTGIAYTPGTHIWDITVRLWWGHGDTIDNVLRDALAFMLADNEVRGKFYDDVVSLLSSYEDFKSSKNQLICENMRELKRSYKNSFLLVRGIYALECNKRALEPKKGNRIWITT